MMQCDAHIGEVLNDRMDGCSEQISTKRMKWRWIGRVDRRCEPAFKLALPF